ncbi:MAG: hypothetical protein DWH97_12580 [Planctomycetota bacterium]|nr:MAG: hypothetical protein DWH97_12580 [Planctomycetota bacterium]RLS96407.1 MAG: hypothetical protein DWI12_01885 [Planctomycetota bacterium]
MEHGRQRKTAARSETSTSREPSNSPDEGQSQRLHETPSIWNDRSSVCGTEPNSRFGSKSSSLFACDGRRMSTDGSR